MAEKELTAADGEAALKAVRELFEKGRASAAHESLVLEFDKRGPFEVASEEGLMEKVQHLVNSLGPGKYRNAAVELRKFDLSEELDMVLAMMVGNSLMESAKRDADARLGNAKKGASARSRLTEVGHEMTDTDKSLVEWMKFEANVGQGLKNLTTNLTTSQLVALEHKILARCGQDHWERDKHAAIAKRLDAGIEEINTIYDRGAEALGMGRLIYLTKTVVSAHRERFFEQGPKKPLHYIR